MTALPKSLISPSAYPGNPVVPRRRQPGLRQAPGNANRLRTNQPADTVKRLPTQEGLPQWLRSLVKLQRGSLVITFTLSGAALAVYGWTVYAQQQFGDQLRTLEELRRTERQLESNNETLKNQTANSAENPNTTLVPQTPKNLIFLKPAPNRDPQSIRNVAPQAAPLPPLGY